MPTRSLRTRIGRQIELVRVGGIAGWLTTAAVLAVASCSSGEPASKPDAAPATTEAPTKDAATSTSQAKKASAAAVIWKGHKALYSEGWYIVTSSRDAGKYAYEHGYVSAGEALAEARQSIAARGSDVPGRIGQGVEAGKQTAAGILETGQRSSASLTRSTDASAARQKEFALKNLGQAGDYVVGGVYYGKRTPEHWARLKGEFPQYFGNLKQDFSNVYELNQHVADNFRTKIEADWDGSWTEATTTFRQHYQSSGEAPNSLVALFDLLAGYGKAFFVGVAEPSGRAAVVGAVGTTRAVTYVFTPAADTVLFIGRTVQSSGLSIYYATETTVDILAPTVEAGYLTGVGLLALGSSGATYAGGQGLGLANEVALSTAALGAGVAQAGVQTAAEAGKYAALVTYDLAKGGTKVVINEVQSGAVLGYNALSALAGHAALLPFDAAYFLAMEGTNLTIVRVTQEPKTGEKSDSKAGGITKVSDLPVGTVVDMKKLKAQEGVKVEVLTDDPEVTHKVLEQMQDDVRVP
jgi:hypothetical protein